jgi:hypothetical protein
MQLLAIVSADHVLFEGVDFEYMLVGLATTVKI